MTDGLINEYYNQLLNSKSPHLVLAKIFRQLFSRELRKSEWGQLGKLTNLYGKWTVLEAMIRAAMNSNFLSDSPWGYFTSICITISKEDRESLENLERIRTLQLQTKKLVEELSKPNVKLKYRKEDYLEK